MVDINSTVFIQIINFLALIFILNQLLYKPILQIMERRKGIFDSAEAEIKRLQDTIDKKVAEYEARIAQAKGEAMAQRGEIQKEGAEKGKEILDGARAEIQKMMDDFQVRMAQEVDGARVILRSHSEKISKEIAEKVLGRSV
ncbi:MAG TPA: ATP synthase F0 subunit B [Syntrophales bacterium]|jgi:F-type H+-transporting ATPase subunit b|nr:ATP synthase F0 subunit B [Syntrophales bacterium]HOX94836.1 ATP synthase F0 subunit B [Syntrophales bacterium]HPI57773.1 ATP synthase F0 subunit B [Syntrophales bacterium]HPN25817.1 ATP synthase F0 subunit B [Syntrophales bacterium]HQM30538.1 ATP synthase F0 subunit B [Syntrophales bacterium]